MNRNEYIRRLDDALHGIDFISRKEIVDEFERHFDEGVMNGRSEEEIAAELGTPEQAADDLRMLRKEESLSDTIAEAASSLAEVIRSTLSSGFDTARLRRNEARTYEGGSDQPFREIRVIGSLASVDVDIQSGVGMEYTFTEGVNLFMANDVQFETEETADVFTFRISRGHGDLSLTIPDSVRQLDILTESGDITMYDLHLENIFVESKSGDIEITKCSGNLKLQTKAGDMEIEDHDGEEADLSCASGDIELTTTARVIHAESSSGDIEIETLSSPEEISALTRSGDIHLELTGSDWHAVLQTSSGEIKNKTRLPAYREGAKLCIGEGSGRITARTGSGDIRIS